MEWQLSPRPQTCVSSSLRLLSVPRAARHPVRTCLHSTEVVPMARNVIRCFLANKHVSDGL